MAKGVKGFQKGQSGNKSGKPPGTKSEKTLAWENLGDFICQAGAERAAEIMMNAPKDKFMIYYTTLLEYFKPKHQRVESNVVIEDNKLEITRKVIGGPNETGA